MANQVKYRNEEMATIDSAWNAVVSFAGIKGNIGAEERLKAALRAERSNVPSMTFAKAVMVRSIVLASRDDIKPHELWALRDGIATMTMFTFAYIDQLREAGIVELAEQAASVHKSAFDRAFEGV